MTRYLPGSRAIFANSSASSRNEGRLSASSIQPEQTQNLLQPVSAYYVANSQTTRCIQTTLHALKTSHVTDNFPGSNLWTRTDRSQAGVPSNTKHTKREKMRSCNLFLQPNNMSNIDSQNPQTTVFALVLKRMIKVYMVHSCNVQMLIQQIRKIAS